MAGVGMMDAKRALVETEGDVEKAMELLRVRGMAKVAKRATERPIPGSRKKPRAATRSASAHRSPS